MLNSLDACYFAKRKITYVIRCFPIFLLILLGAPGPPPSRTTQSEPIPSSERTDLHSYCTHPKSLQELEACQQWRMAEATEYMAWLTKLQLIIGACSVAGLGLTILYTMRATHAARVAATAAEQSVLTSRETMQRQLRAYILVSQIRMERLKHGMTPKCTVVLQNTGQTPAHDVECGVHAEMADAKSPTLEATDFSIIDSRAPLAADVPIKLEIYPPNLILDDYTILADGAKAIYVYGEVRYKDIFNMEHYTRYRFRSTQSNFIEEDGRMQTCFEGNEAT
jgi:hypothetical protein